MDPRTAAKVSSPDLLKAFNEGRGLEPADGDEETISVYVLKFVNGRCVEVCEFLLEALDAALAEVKHHLAKGSKHDVLLMVDPDELPGVEEVRRSISANDG